jgi:hypothetical protein
MKCTDELVSEDRSGDAILPQMSVFVRQAEDKLDLRDTQDTTHQLEEL